jgi:hypothetical protein
LAKKIAADRHAHIMLHRTGEREGTIEEGNIEAPRQLGRELRRN